MKEKVAIILFTIMETSQDNAQVAQERTIPTELTPERAARVLFVSFKYSQGDTDLQTMLFRYLHKLQPNWRIPDENFKATMFQLVQKRAQKFVLPNAAQQEGEARKPTNHPKKREDAENDIDPDFVDTTLKEEMANMQEAFTDLPKYEKLSRTKLAARIGNEIIERDYEFLTQNGGRKREQPDPAKPSQDPWSSHFIEYGLLRKRTELPEFDALFDDIRKGIEEAKINLETPNALSGRHLYWLQQIIPVYNQHHPDNIVTI